MPNIIEKEKLNATMDKFCPTSTVVIEMPFSPL
jgi:hypothetical protein